MMVSTPRISLLINNYNYDRFLDAALGSALADAGGEAEIVVVDDGSTDGSVARLRAYEGRVRLVLRPTCGGQGTAVADGIRACRGEVIVLLDADDELLSGRLAAVRACFDRQPALTAVLHELRTLDGSGRPGAPLLGMKARISDLSRVTRANAGLPVIESRTSGLAVRADIARTALPVIDGLHRGVDFMLAGVAMLCGPVQVLAQPLGGYRLHGRNMSRLDAGNLAGQWRDRLRLWREYRRRLAAHLPPATVAGLAPAHQALSFAVASFMLAHMEARPRRAHIWYRRVRRHPAFGLMTPARRCYWIATRFVPPPLVRGWLIMGYGQGRLKRWYRHVVGWVRW